MFVTGGRIKRLIFVVLSINTIILLEPNISSKAYNKLKLRELEKQNFP